MNYKFASSQNNWEKLNTNEEFLKYYWHLAPSIYIFGAEHLKPEMAKMLSVEPVTKESEEYDLL